MKYILVVQRKTTTEMKRMRRRIRIRC